MHILIIYVSVFIASRYHQYKILKNDVIEAKRTAVLSEKLKYHCDCSPEKFYKLLWEFLNALHRATECMSYSTLLPGK